VSLRKTPWWHANGRNRCKAPSPTRHDNRCHNQAAKDDLCKVHLKLAGKLKKCPTCGRWEEL